MSIYPFTLYPNEYSTGHAESPRLAQAVWTRLRKEDLKLETRTWYAVGVEVDEEVLELRIYRMHSSIYGGLGGVGFTLPVKRSDLTPAEQSLLLAAEQHEALEIADQEIERQDNEMYRRRRQALASALFPHLFNAQTKE